MRREAEAEERRILVGDPTRPAPQGLMGMAGIAPSGTEYKPYNPVKP
jgi:hypothetical protein